MMTRHHGVESRGRLCSPPFSRYGALWSKCSRALALALRHVDLCRCVLLCISSTLFETTTPLPGACRTHVRAKASASCRYRPVRRNLRRHVPSFREAQFKDSRTGNTIKIYACG